MLSFRSILGAVALIVSTALPSLAEDFALVLTNRSYPARADAKDVARHNGFKSALERAGFSVLQGQDMDAQEMSRLAADFHARLRRGQVDRVIVVLSGHFVDGPANSWLLARDSRALNAYSVGQFGLSMAAINDTLAQHAGKAMLVLTPSGANLELGAGLRKGTARVSLHHGVTMMQGRADPALDILRSRVLAGHSLRRVARDAAGVTLSGYLPDQPLGGITVPPRRVVSEAEESFWRAARRLDSIEGYEAYLRRYPNGAYVDTARQRIAELRDGPRRTAKDAEDALKLTRVDRREIQRKLSYLGFDTRGVDGVFGRGTRAAIAEYQRSKGVPATGYLTGNLIVMLNRDYEGAGRDRRSDEERARIAWEQVSAEDTIEAYRDFMRHYPNSQYQAEAEARVQELLEDRSNRKAIERDRAEEEKFLRGSNARLLIEKGLQARGYQPGFLDGKFDRTARRAIRKFQRDSGMTPTGYVSHKTMLLLMIPVERN